MLNHILLLQAQSAPGKFGLETNLLFFAAIIFIFYFFMIRPQSKRAKEEKAFRESLNKGDKVVTIGGIHGKVVSIEDNTVLVQVDDTTKLRFDKVALRPAPIAAEAKS